MVLKSLHSTSPAKPSTLTAPFSGIDDINDGGHQHRELGGALHPLDGLRVESHDSIALYLGPRQHPPPPPPRRSKCHGINGREIPARPAQGLRGPPSSQSVLLLCKTDERDAIRYHRPDMDVGAQQISEADRHVSFAHALGPAFLAFLGKVDDFAQLQTWKPKAHQLLIHVDARRAAEEPESLSAVSEWKEKKTAR